jgi:hypothetical protein
LTWQDIIAYPSRVTSMSEGNPLRRGPTLRRTGERAKCRFCGRSLPRPKKRDDALNPNLPGASCPCGAFFVVDPTGRNGGVALMEALTDAAGGKAGAGNFMVPRRDYNDYIENYDTQAHRFITGFRGYRRGMARLYLVKLIEPSQE